MLSVGAVIHDSAGDVFAALSERVCDSSLIIRMYIITLSHAMQIMSQDLAEWLWNVKTRGWLMHLQM